MKVPQRTCVVCRGVEAKNELLRFVVEGSELVFDPNHRAPGRGAYVHRSPSCLNRACEPKVWRRGFRAHGQTPENSAVIRLFTELYGENSSAPVGQRRGRKVRF